MAESQDTSAAEAWARALPSDNLGDQKKAEIVKAYTATGLEPHSRLTKKEMVEDIRALDFAKALGKMPTGPAGPMESKTAKPASGVESPEHLRQVHEKLDRILNMLSENTAAQWDKPSAGTDADRAVAEESRRLIEEASRKWEQGQGGLPTASTNQPNQPAPLTPPMSAAPTSVSPSAGASSRGAAGTPAAPAGGSGLAAPGGTGAAPAAPSLQNQATGQGKSYEADPETGALADAMLKQAEEAKMKKQNIPMEAILAGTEMEEARTRFAKASAMREKYRREHTGKIQKIRESFGLKPKPFEAKDERGMGIEHEYEIAEKAYREAEAKFGRASIFAETADTESERLKQRGGWIDSVLNERGEFNKEYAKQLLPQKENRLNQIFRWYGGMSKSKRVAMSVLIAGLIGTGVGVTAGMTFTAALAGVGAVRATRAAFGAGAAAAVSDVSGMGRNVKADRKASEERG